MRIRLSVCLLCLILVTVFLSSCSIFNSMVGQRVKKPEVDFVGAKLSNLSFDAADLLFDLKIRNPNAVGLKMAGFDYDLLINGNSFLNGKQDRNVEIGAGGESTVQVPLRLGYLNLYQTFQSLRDQDASTYQVNFGFSFDVPVLGVVNIPVSKSGELPLLKLPKVKLEALKVGRLSLTNSELLLSVKLDNPNAFSMLLDQFQYQFDVSGRSWFSGDSRDSVQIPEKGESLISIPVSINFLEVGRAAYQLITGDSDLDYQFGGEIDLDTSVPLLGRVSLPFDHSGKIKVIR